LKLTLPASPSDPGWSFPFLQKVWQWLLPFGLSVIP